MKLTVTRAITAGTIATALALGGTGVAMATSAAASTPADATSGEQDSSYVGSIPAPNESTEGAEGSEGAEGAEGAKDTAESAALASLATITPDEAAAAALKAVPGTVTDTHLEDENGYVVYGVYVTAADGSVTEVKIDAGNGSMLAQETADSETADSETADSETAD